MVLEADVEALQVRWRQAVATPGGPKGRRRPDVLLPGERCGEVAMAAGLVRSARP
ncbi:hypothetical protein ACWGKU_04145 [Kitasatospora sp. NPDC054768]